MSHREAKRIRKLLKDRGLPVNHEYYNKIYKGLKSGKVGPNRRGYDRTPMFSKLRTEQEEGT